MAKARKAKPTVQAAQPVTPVRRQDQARLLVMTAAGIVMACILIYAQTSGHDFIQLDDTLYLHENGWVNRGLSWAGVKWAMTSAGYYY